VEGLRSRPGTSSSQASGVGHAIKERTLRHSHAHKRNCRTRERPPTLSYLEITPRLSGANTSSILRRCSPLHITRSKSLICLPAVDHFHDSLRRPHRSDHNAFARRRPGTPVPIPVRQPRRRQNRSQYCQDSFASFVHGRILAYSPFLLLQKPAQSFRLLSPQKSAKQSNPRQLQTSTDVARGPIGRFRQKGRREQNRAGSFCNNDNPLLPFAPLWRTADRD
jgi:hypothetical protein